jgi:hypothetical protein
MAGRPAAWTRRELAARRSPRVRRRRARADASLPRGFATARHTPADVSDAARAALEHAQAPHVEATTVAELALRYDRPRRARAGGHCRGTSPRRSPRSAPPPPTTRVDRRDSKRHLNIFFSMLVSKSRETDNSQPFRRWSPSDDGDDHRLTVTLIDDHRIDPQRERLAGPAVSLSDNSSG